MRYLNILLSTLFALAWGWGVVADAQASGPAPGRADDDVRIIQWAGRAWRVRPWPGGPGPNDWCDTPDCVWVDESGALHLTIRHINGKWYASEVNTVDFTNLGEHRFYVEGPIDQLAPDVVLGLFLYSNIQDDDVEELDVEFSRWGDTDPDADEGWYTTWSQNDIGDQYSFDVALEDAYSTHAIDWQTNEVDFESLQGFHAQAPDPSAIIAQWQTTTPAVIPAPEDEMRIHINLWLMNGWPPTDGQEVEIVIHDLDAPPEIPKNVQAGDGLSSTQVQITWDAVATADSYKVFRAETPTGTKTLLGTTVSATFDDGTATPDHPYTYWVTGLNDQGESLFSVSDEGRRAIPMQVSALLSNVTDVDLQWTHQDAACDYSIHRDAAPYFLPSSETLADTLSAPASSYSFPGDAGQPGQNHYYLVQATGCESGLPSDSNRTGEFDFALTPGS